MVSSRSNNINTVDDRHHRQVEKSEDKRKKR